MRLNAYPLLALLLAGPASAGVVYDVPSSAIVYGHNFQSSAYRAAGSFQSDAAGSNLTSVTWYVRVDGNWAAINSGSNPLAAGTRIDLSLYSNGGSNQPGTLIGNLGSISLAGLGANQGMQPFSLTGISAPLAPSTYYWIVGSSNAPDGAIELGLYANAPSTPFAGNPQYTGYNTYGALLSTNSGATWTGGQSGGFGFFFAGQVTVPETSSSLPLVGLSSALLGFLALRRRR